MMTLSRSGMSRAFLPALLLFSTFAVLSRGIAQDKSTQGKQEPELLFFLSGDKGFEAEVAATGTSEPTFLRDVSIIPDGAKGPGFRCEDKQLFAYRAPGNIYAERGTLSFFWRSHTPVGKTQFPIFRVGYAEHSSWDMVWLRIDYNGHGFDAFVTDVNLARIRVSCRLSPFPRPDSWIHLALTWDETTGVRFYVNGKLAARKDSTAVLFAGLDQFGPHSRIIGPSQVQSAYNFQRGGDIDEIRIYDRMLPGAAIVRLAAGRRAGNKPDVRRRLDDPRWQAEWRLRNGWDRKGNLAPYLASPVTSVRKVEIHNVYDLKRWWWKATDGIRETTWPGVYNRSRISGRNDYFQLPDWDCYSLSGKSVTFFMPDEPWNHLEISGGAWGSMQYFPHGDSAGSAGQLLFERPRGEEKTVHHFDRPFKGGRLRFTNVEQETPIGELSAYDVRPGTEPTGIRVVQYSPANLTEYSGKGLDPLTKFISGRYLPDERATVVALSASPGHTAALKSLPGALPIVHILIPSDGLSAQGADADSAQSWWSADAGLDGIAIDLPAMDFKSVGGGLLPLNIQVKDPIWPMRNMLDFDFSVKPGEARTLWLDLRDRILAKGEQLYLTIASDNPGFGAEALQGMVIRLVFKPRAIAEREHVQDRFTQVRDNFANFVEEHVTDKRMNLYNRLQADLNDLLRISPKHYPGQTYAYDLDRTLPKPLFVQPAAPEGVPLWAFRQVEDLRYFKRFVLWWIDHRQISNGELGGGLSDDDDLTNCWPGAALMGVEPENIRSAVLKMLDAIYAQGMFTNGLSTIQTDGLHAHEEGIEAQAQAMLVDYGSPKQVERMMETVRALDERLMLKNKNGHRHFRSSYFSGTKMAGEDPWDWALQQQEFLLMQPVITLAAFNGNPRARQLAIDMADGLLAHARKDEKGKVILDTEINFTTDSARSSQLGSKGVLASSVAGAGATMSTSSAGLQLLWSVFRLTGEFIYLQPLVDLGPEVLAVICNDGLDMLNVRDRWGTKIARSTSPDKGPDFYRHLAWQMTGNKKYLEGYYGDQIESSALREYINTEGSLWTDRVFAANRELQRSRLGGIALVRGAIHSGHSVSWEFLPPATEESVAILVPVATPDSIAMLVYGLDKKPVDAKMTTWDIEPGVWEVEQGIDRDGDEKPDTILSRRTIALERSGSIDLTFPPRSTSTLRLKLLTKAVPYAERPDLGIDPEDVRVDGNKLTVNVHSLGSVASSPATLALLRNGAVLASVIVPALEPPLDLRPRRHTSEITVPAGTNLNECEIRIDPERRLNEITAANNQVECRTISSQKPVTQNAIESDEMTTLPEGPRPEHLAFNVADPEAVADWYCSHLGMKVMRKTPPPGRGRLVADSAQTMMLELTHSTSVPFFDGASISQSSLHLAFMVDDITTMRDSLVRAGARVLDDITSTPSGDKVLMMRDPWGLAIQFVSRINPMLRPHGVRFEHLAVNVPDSKKMTNWYVENLGMKVMRESLSPTYASFVGNEGGNMMLEIGANPAAPLLDARGLSTRTMHFAFVVADVRSIRNALLAAGATLVEEVRISDSGDEVVVLRDPWGFPIQFLKRGTPVLK